MKNKKKRFNWRAWTTFVVIVSFIVDTISGIILYISPHGRVANWTNWGMWGLEKGDWEAIHTVFGYILLIIVGFHLYYNWKMFWSFIWSKIRKALNMKWEITAAILINLLIFVGTVWEIPPFSTTMNLGDHFKESWEDNKADTPVVQAQLLTLQEFGDTIQAPVDQLISALKAKGYKVENAQQTLDAIAQANSTSPDKLYEAIKSEGVKPVVSGSAQGSGMGRKTLEVICSEKGLSLDDVLSKLKQKGLDAEPGDKLRDVADKFGKTTTEIIAIIEAKE